MPPDFLSSGLVAGFEPPGGAELAAGRLPLPNGDDPPLDGLPEPLEPLPKDDPLLPAGRLGELELPELLPLGEFGLLLAGRLPLPNGDDPPLDGLPEPLEPPPKDDPLLPAGRLPLPNVLPDEPELPPGELELLPAGRLLPNGDVPPLGLEPEPPGVPGRLPPADPDDPSGGREPDAAELLGGGLVRAPAPGKPEVGRLPRLLELPNGFTRD
jgi:hypothetical protein